MSLIPLLFRTTCLSEWTLLISWDLFRVKKYLLNVREVLSTMLSSVEGIEANSGLSFCLQGVNYSATGMEYIYLCTYCCCCLVAESRPTLLQPHAFHRWLARHLCPHIYVYFICMAYIRVCVLYICVYTLPASRTQLIFCQYNYGERLFGLLRWQPWIFCRSGEAGEICLVCFVYVYIRV